MATGLFAQDKCCDPSTVAPEVTTGTSAAMLVGNNTVAPTLAVQASSDLPGAPLSPLATIIVTPLAAILRYSILTLST